MVGRKGCNSPWSRGRVLSELHCIIKEGTPATGEGETGFLKAGHFGKEGRREGKEQLFH